MPSHPFRRSAVRRSAPKLAVTCLALAVLASAAAAQDVPANPLSAAAPVAPAAAPVPAAPAPAATAAPAAPESRVAPSAPSASPPATTPPMSDAAPTNADGTAPRLSVPAAGAAGETPAEVPFDAPAASGIASETLASGSAGNGPAASLPHDLSPLGMFMAADIVVKAVMLGLAFASVVTWTIWLAKALELAMARRRAKRALERLERAQGLGEITGGDRDSGWPRRGPVAALAAAAALEIARSQHLPADGVKERVQIALQRIEARAGRSMSRGTGLLATIGSTAPFVGLFGTVWGIMNAFIGISRANTTNLAVVAPGIAEALLATAIGLVAAIPAVIIYNVFARSIAGYRAVLADASAEVLRHLSRDLDRRERFVATERRQAAE